jgi:hypothetical protein
MTHSFYGKDGRFYRYYRCVKAIKSGSDSGSGPPGSGSGSGSAQQSVALGEGASSFIEGGMEGVPPAKWQQSGVGSLSSSIEEEVKA